MKIGYLQIKPEFGDIERNILKIQTMVKDEEFDLLVLPELANSGYLFAGKEELENLSEEIGKGIFSSALKEISREKNAFIVSGICEKSKEKYYNSSILINPEGQFFTYRKIHLFDQEKLWFEPGDASPEVFEISGENFGNVKIGMMICFDWIFPEVARTLALKGAQIICHPSNLVMPYCQKAMFTRAVENRVFTITTNRVGTEIKDNNELSFTGESVILSPRGEYLCTGSKDGEEICFTEINPGEALNKNVTERNNIFEDRKKEFYIT